MPNKHQNLLVFTDLDGTLLDHETYSHAAAQPALDLLAKRNIALIINTSKTAAEVIPWQTRLNISAPFIVENGSACGVATNDKRFKTPEFPTQDKHFWHCLGAPRSAIQYHLHELRSLQHFKFLMFADMTLKDLEKHTGLPPEECKLAQQREYSEPLLWQESQPRLREFIHALKPLGLRCIKGGRFLHVLGHGADKGHAMDWLKQASTSEKPLVTVALGDGDNDIGMLNNADIAVRVRSPHHDYPNAQGRQQTYSTQAYGPAGWAQAIQKILQEISGK